MKKIIRLTEGDLVRLVKRVINESEKDSLIDSCQSGKCADLFRSIMSKFGWDTKYTKKEYPNNPLITYVGKNSKGQKIVILTPQPGADTLSFTVHGKSYNLPLFEVLSNGAQFENGDCSIKPSYELCEYFS